MTKTAIFAGTFDPFTMGHYDIVSRAASVFDTIYVAVAEDTGKSHSIAGLELRVKIAASSMESFKNVIVVSFSGFLTDFMRKVNAKFLIRGLRSSDDFDYERGLMHVYKSQNPEIETFYLISSQNFSHISGTIVRELARLGGNLDGYVHKAAAGIIDKIYSGNKRENLKERNSWI